MPTTRIGFGSALALFLALGSASATAAQTEPAITVERQLDATTLTRLRALAPDQEARITLHRDDSASAGGDWNLRRLEVYAPDAQLWVATARGLEPMPRSNLVHFVGVRAGERLSLSLAPGLSHGEGLLLGEEGSFRLDVTPRADGGLTLSGISTEAALPDGSLPEADCLGGLEGDASWRKALTLHAPTAAATPKVATRKVTLAIDTDNELLQQKFSNNTTSAGNYMAALVAGMSAIYEMEPGAGGAKIKLEIGSQILRPSTITDPYPSEVGSDTLDQLNEFGLYWKNNYPYASYPRAFALMISGKSAAPYSANGIAWLVSGNDYCAATGTNYGGQIYGHYSVNRVYKYAGATAADDVSLVAHELGHNFGLSHTHCTNTSGAFPSAVSTLDRCFSGESGCYTGTTSCPTSPAPGAPKGTLMSYCHMNGCGQPNASIIHPVQVTTINTRIAAQSPSCVVAIASPNQPPSITAPASVSVTEDVASPLAGITFADSDAGSGSLTATFTVPAGSLTTTGSGVTVGGTPTARTLTGTLTALNAFIAAGNLRYTTAANATGSVTLGIVINDNGNTGSGGAQSATRNVSIAIQAVNDTPGVAAPALMGLPDTGTTAVSGVSFSDVDAGSGDLIVTLNAPAAAIVNGTSGGGVTTSGSGSTRSFQGTLANLNAYFGSAQVSLTTAGFTAIGTLAIDINDNGNTGSGGPKTASASVALKGGILFANGFE